MRPLPFLCIASRQSGLVGFLGGVCVRLLSASVHASASAERPAIKTGDSLLTVASVFNVASHHFDVVHPDMRRDVQEIFRNTPHHKQVMMFSATLSKDVRITCKKFMANVRIHLLVVTRNY